MPVSKKPRSKTVVRTSPKASAPAALPDRRAMESFLAAIAGHRGDEATAKAQDVMYEAWELTTSRSRIPFPQGYRDLRYNPDKSVLGIVTGIGTARATASIKALGMDPRFDLSKAYWLVAGIAGVNPNEASIGSATWAEWVIDSDLGFEVDAREIPASCTRSAREF
jgi:hypothetical protein